MSTIKHKQICKDGLGALPDIEALAKQLNIKTITIGAGNLSSDTIGNQRQVRQRNNSKR